MKIGISVLLLALASCATEGSFSDKAVAGAQKGCDAVRQACTVALTGCSLVPVAPDAPAEAPAAPEQ